MEKGIYKRWTTRLRIVRAMQLPPRLLDLTPVMESCEYVSLHRLLRRNTICLFEMFGKIKNLAEEKTLSDRTKGRKNLLRFVFFSFETMQNVERTKIFRAKPILGLDIKGYEKCKKLIETRNEEGICVFRVKYSFGWDCSNLIFLTAFRYKGKGSKVTCTAKGRVRSSVSIAAPSYEPRERSLANNR